MQHLRFSHIEGLHKNLEIEVIPASYRKQGIGIKFGSVSVVERSTGIEIAT